MKQSMSRVGRCIDNGPMESFWSTLKCEKYYRRKYKTFIELTLAINEYIHFYNHDRYQKRLTASVLWNIELKPLRSFLLFPLST
jgi:transposase InsO family protein